MSWTILYHQTVEDDLKNIAPAAARRILHAIDNKLTQSPLQFGAPLSGNLSAFRKLRVGDYRIVYKVNDTRVSVFTLAADPRRNKEVYTTAGKREM